MSSNTAPGAGSWEPDASLGDQVTGPAEVFESMLLEDGVLGAIETVLSGLQVAGTDPVTLQLEGMKLLAADVARRMTRPDPFAVAEHDDGWFVPSDLPLGQATEPGADVEAAGSDTCGAGLAPEAAAAAPASGSLDTTADDAASAGTSAAELPQAWRDADAAAARLARFEDATVAAHQVMNQAGAVRAYAAERCARFDTASDSTPWSAADCLTGDAPRPGDVTEHPPGHRGRFTGDLLAPSLRLGPQAADSVVDAAVWLTQRTPALLAAVARGEANLDTAAAIARELQDARPDTCELVEDAVLGRGVHQRSLSPARRSARVLVERFEATAARTTLRRTQAQQTGVWLDTHPTPGLSSLTAVMPTGHAASVMDAVDQRARQTQHATAAGGSGEEGDASGGGALLLGQHRANALHDLILGNVDLTAHLQLVVPPRTGPGPGGGSGPGQGPGGDNGHGSGSGSDHDSDLGGDSDPGTAAGPEPDSGDPGHGMADPEAARRRAVVTPRQAARILADAAVVVIHDRAGPVPTDQVIELLTTRAHRVTVEHVDPCARARGPDDPVGRDGPDSYRPGARLRRAVKRRDRRCRFPGCDRRTTFTDLDHVEPWPRGRTSASNLQNLCRHHHCTKHQAGWRVVMTPDGTCTWTSPTGRTHTTQPGLLELLDDLAYAVTLDR
ncbi:HNH endonuclease signature motif containing protein [Barrientosiimonas humi]|uniref:HNH endonuclease signature motif containing protein n=1 Tax=Barrientosiimonas humi TaxID=999931 RepID=UPI00370DCA79